MTKPSRAHGTYKPRRHAPRKTRQVYIGTTERGAGKCRCSGRVYGRAGKAHGCTLIHGHEGPCRGS